MISQWGTEEDVWNEGKRKWEKNTRKNKKN
jgi:hypothetical protein